MDINDIRRAAGLPINESDEKQFIESWLKRMDISVYTINDDLTVDVDNDVLIANKDLTKLPFKFGKVYGNFYASHNKLTSLKNAPDWVNGNFDVSFNLLTTLLGAPDYVGGNFYYNNNHLIPGDKVGIPKHVGGKIVK